MFSSDVREIRTGTAAAERARRCYRSAPVIREIDSGKQIICQADAACAL